MRGIGAVRMVHHHNLIDRFSSTMNQPLDLATQSNYLSVSTSHVHFDWSIDWTKRVISGSATHTLIAHQDVNQVMWETHISFASTL